jgi:hypothetical protein
LLEVACWVKSSALGRLFAVVALCMPFYLTFLDSALLLIVPLFVLGPERGMSSNTFAAR